MIPEFDEYGNLPPGVHIATLAEVVERFGRGNEVREAMGHSLVELVEACDGGRAIRLAVNGSFVTRLSEPNDVDCILLLNLESAELGYLVRLIDEGIPYLSIQAIEEAED